MTVMRKVTKMTPCQKPMTPIQAKAISISEAASMKQVSRVAERGSPKSG